MKNGISTKWHKPPFNIVTAPLIIFSGASLNLLFWFFSDRVLHAPIFMDSIFTAIVAALYGPVPGMITGLLTNVENEFIMGFPGIHWPFGFCNLATGLIVGIMARKGETFIFGWNSTMTILLVTVANSILGTLIAMLLFSGNTEVSLDFIISTLTELGQTLFAANFWSRILTNLIDKMIAVYAAFGTKALLEKDTGEN
ncbi:MAG: ECF transporter S component [Spirochaetales bacterium]|nr:ECF transporter S component [Spirochaetales bacterium]